MKQAAFVFMLLTLSLSQAYGQVDSLKIVLEYQSGPEERIPTLYQLARELVIQGDTAAVSYMNEGADLCKRQQEYKTLANFYFLKGYFLDSQKRYTESYLAFTYASEVYKELGEIKQYGNSRIYIGQYLMEIAQLAAAETEYRELEAMMIEYGQDTEVGVIHQNLAYVYEKGDRLEEAIQELEAADYYFKKTEEMGYALRTQKKLADLYRDQGAFDKAKVLYDQVLAANEGLTTTLEAYTQFNLGMLFHAQGQPEKALAYMTQGYDYAYSQWPAHSETFKMATVLGEFYLNAGKSNEALSILEAQQAHLGDKLGNPRLSFLEMVSKTYEAQGRWEDALVVERSYHNNKVGIVAAEQQAVLARQEAEIVLAQSILLEQAAAGNRSQLHTLWLLGICLLVIFASGISVFFYRKMIFFRRMAQQRSTNWPELQKRMDALEDTLGLMG